jgi:predicted MFS family arabinose efflux permease
MIVCDLVRALLVAVMAVPGIPVAALVVLLFLVTLVGAPFSAARAALYPDILQGDRYVLGTAVTITTIQFAQVIGFAAGGVVVGFFGVRTSLVIDAITFVLSAMFTVAWVRSRPAAASPDRAVGSARAGILTGARLVFADPRLRVPMLLAWLAAFTDIYEGVAAPLAKGLDGGALAVGMVLASGALGTSLGAVGFSRLVRPDGRLRWMSPLALAACSVLILFVLGPDLPVALIILVAAGALCCYQLAANASFVAATPPAQRSQAFGLAQGGISLGQSAAIVAAGAAASYLSPSVVIACGGALGVLTWLAIVRTSTTVRTKGP